MNTTVVKIKSRLFRPYLLDLIDFYKSDLKCYQFDVEPTLSFYAAVYLYTCKFDKIIGFNSSDKSGLLKITEEILFELKNFKDDMSYATNLVLNESIQFNLPKNFWLEAVLNLSENPCPCFIKLKDLEQVGEKIVENFKKFSTYFVLNNNSRHIYRSIIIREITDLKKTGKFESSFSASFGVAFISFGMNKILHERLIDRKILIIRGKIRNETHVIPTSICTLQEESEIVLIPGTKVAYSEKFQKLNKDYVVERLGSAPDLVIDTSAHFLDNFNNIYMIDILINLRFKKKSFQFYFVLFSKIFE
jgi:hypothetical protein